MGKKEAQNPFNPETHPYCLKGHQYALDVVSGKIVANIYIIGSCKRYLEDIERFTDSSCLYYFDEDRAEHFLKVVQRMRHVIGKWKNPYIIYEPWQCWFWMNVIGWQNTETQARKYRTAWCMVSRGNAKSTMASQAALYVMNFDNPLGNECSVAATRRDQARIVLDAARNMARGNKSFLKHTGAEVLAHKIVNEQHNSSLVAVSADHSGLDGRNDVLCICDEIHAMNRKTFETLESGMSKRNDSLLLGITTAGYDVTGVGHSMDSYARKVALGEVKDETFFAAVYTLDENDDPFDENVWIKSNPNLGVSVNIENFRAKALKAKASPSDLNNFKIKHLNLWVSEANAFFSQQKWDACEDKTLNINDFKNERCFVGLDMSSKIDLTSSFFIFKRDGIYYLFDKTYCPEVTISESRNDLYAESVAGNYLIATKGEAIHYPTIQKDIVDASKIFRIEEVLFDPWNFTEGAQRLTAERINMVEFRMNTPNLSEPTKKLDALIREGRVRHNGSPLLRWCLGNVVCKEDAAGNVFPKKNDDKLKIDPIVAAIMALGGWVNYEESQSVYEKRKMRFL